MNELSPPRLARALLGFAAFLLLVPALLFLCAGTLSWPMAWIYVTVLLISGIGSRLVVWRRNPDLLRERARFTGSADTPVWDRWLVLVVGLVGPMLMAAIAGLDHRSGWSSPVPALVQVVAALILTLSYGLAVWAMVANPFFSAVARIQKDRGQEVITQGPYRLVRHPAYAGSVIASVAFPFMLGSLWALLPGLANIAGVAIRTWQEDSMLMDRLDGYQAYAVRTRYRLVPGIW